jgi:signal transduction histidine kinase
VWRELTKHGDKVKGDRGEQPFTFADKGWALENGFFQTIIDLGSRPATSNRGTLRILYPEEEYRRAWQSAAAPSLVMIVLAAPVAVVLAVVTAARISRPVRGLQQQVEHIAHGRFEQLPLPDRDDEIRALSASVNCMAHMLARYEAEVRRTERMRALAHLGGGIAHQLRNSATGCRIALDLHAGNCGNADCESLEVARRQLQLMEEYIRRYLQLGQAAPMADRQPVDLPALVAEVISLVAPAARHAGVRMIWEADPGQLIVWGSPDRLRQLLLNLIMNATEAATRDHLKEGTAAQVAVKLEHIPPDQVRLTITDTGGGPSADIATNLFEPFVTDKADGVGLGLSVAHEVVHELGGRIEWRRADEQTQFIVHLPSERRGNLPVPAGSDSPSMFDSQS